MTGLNESKKYITKKTKNQKETDPKVLHALINLNHPALQQLQVRDFLLVIIYVFVYTIFCVNELCDIQDMPILFSDWRKIWGERLHIIKNRHAGRGADARE